MLNNEMASSLSLCKLFHFELDTNSIVPSSDTSLSLCFENELSSKRNIFKQPDNEKGAKDNKEGDFESIKSQKPNLHSNSVDHFILQDNSEYLISLESN